MFLLILAQWVQQLHTRRRHRDSPLSWSAAATSTSTSTASSQFAFEFFMNEMLIFINWCIYLDSVLFFGVFSLFVLISLRCFLLILFLFVCCYNHWLMIYKSEIHLNYPLPTKNLLISSLIHKHFVFVNCVKSLFFFFLPLSLHLFLSYYMLSLLDLRNETLKFACLFIRSIIYESRTTFIQKIKRLFKRNWEIRLRECEIHLR